MRRYGPMDDLLRNKRRTRYRRPDGRRKWIVVTLIAAAVAGWWVYGRDLGEAGDAEPSAADEAALVVAAALDGAPGRLQPAGDDPAGDASDGAGALATGLEAVVRLADEAALHAVFEPGKPVVLRGELEKNESVFLALQNRNISPGHIHSVVTATGKEFNFRRSRPGDQWQAEVDAEGRITRFRYQTSPEDIWVTALGEDGQYTCTKESVATETRLEAIGGNITSTFWQALEASGEQGQLAFRFMEIFAYTIDFNTETREGDQFAMVFEKKFLDGKFLRYGDIVAAKYVGPTGTHYGYLHDSGEERGYFDADGDNLQRQFLRSPLPVTRITSRFGRRVHPVLGNVHMHAGVDYAAPIGTPVQTVADGTVTFAGWKGANGKLVAIRHSGGYETYYAHLNTIGKGIAPGKRVTRGTIIGRSGNTGRSTGPHLHFGMKQNGKYVDPLKIDAVRGDPLRGKALDAYKVRVAELRRQMEEVLAGEAPAVAVQ